MNKELKWFFDTSHELGSDINLVQGTGGNISIKFDKNMTIKSSGVRLDNVNENKGYVVVDHDKIANTYLKDLQEEESDRMVNASVVSGIGKPSIETGFHSFLKKYVIHLHPVSLNVILCSKNGKETISGLFNDIDFVWVPYFKVGHKVSMEIKRRLLPETEIIFLENHGIIITSDSPDCSSTLAAVMDRVNSYLGNVPGFSQFIYSKLTNTENVFVNSSELVVKNSQKILSEFLFPDAAVFATTDKIDIGKGGVFYHMNFENARNIDEILSAHAYLHEMTSKIGGSKKFTELEVSELLGMESEKYRRKLMGL